MKKFDFFNFEINGEFMNGYGIYDIYDFSTRIHGVKGFSPIEILSLLNDKFETYIELREEIEERMVREITPLIIAEDNSRLKNKIYVGLILDDFFYYCGSEEFVVTYYCPYLLEGFSVEAVIAEGEIENVSVVTYSNALFNLEGEKTGIN
ncbi:MAG: hypothetical protein LUE26_09380 [Alistipes sp.]|nr:hypothetical protein [Alistipes sp.]